jgi:phage regulator Rha-like protein
MLIIRSENALKITKRAELSQKQWKEIEKLDKKIEICIKEIKGTGRRVKCMYKPRPGSYCEYEGYTSISDAQITSAILRALRERKKTLIQQRENLITQYKKQNKDIEDKKHLKE